MNSFRKLYTFGCVLKMENPICTCTMDAICGDQVCQQTIGKRKREKTVWDTYRQMFGTIGEYALEVLRSNNEPEAIFSNGGTRVLIRPDRIDLI